MLRNRTINPAGGLHSTVEDILTFDRFHFGGSDLPAILTDAEARVPDATADTWPLFQHEAARSHAATFPSRADEYGRVMRTKLEAAQRARPDAVDAAARAVDEWRRFRPEVDLYVSPCYAVELPAEDADELEVRLPLSSFLRWVNLVGWAGLAIGNLQLVAPADEVVRCEECGAILVRIAQPNA